MGISLPNWRKPEQYPSTDEASNIEFAWEFLRRNPNYQKEYNKFKSEWIDTLDQQKKEAYLWLAKRLFEGPLGDIDHIQEVKPGLRHLTWRLHRYILQVLVPEYSITGKKCIMPDPNLSYKEGAEPNFHYQPRYLTIYRYSNKPVDTGILPDKKESRKRDKVAFTKLGWPCFDDAIENRIGFAEEDACIKDASEIQEIKVRARRLLVSIDLQGNISGQIDMVKEIATNHAEKLKRYLYPEGPPPSKKIHRAKLQEYLRILDAEAMDEGLTKWQKTKLIMGQASDSSYGKNKKKAEKIRDHDYKKLITL
ncbi:MAG TPA: hypothetical protein DDX99_12315 [Desulfofustis sp.]|jgi:hypothetical protein|nr:hypothetical protein [Desulfofustis sp.]